MPYTKRLEKVKALLKENSIDFFIFDDHFSILYLTGLKISFGKLVVSQNKIKLFTDPRYLEACRKKQVSSELFNEKTFSSFLIENSNNNIIGIDKNKFTLNSFEKLNFFLNKIKNNSDIEFKIVLISDPLQEIRLIKDSLEISSLKKSAELNWRGFEHICLLLKEGITEKQLAVEYELFCRKNGAQKVSFDPIFAFGKNSSCPHHEPTDKKLQLNEIVLMDLGVMVDNYASDMTRVIFFGKNDPQLEKIYNIVKKAQAKALELCKPGVKIRDLDLAARNYIEKEGYGKEFMHALGHGVGLEVHEFPKIKSDGEDKDLVLKAGMVITIEPGIYLEGIGGVRYEDTIVITNNGYDNFYTSF